MTYEKANVTIDQNQPIFMGMDVHKTKWSVCFIHQGEIVGQYLGESLRYMPHDGSMGSKIFSAENVLGKLVVPLPS